MYWNNEVVAQGAVPLPRELYRQFAIVGHSDWLKFGSENGVSRPRVYVCMGMFACMCMYVWVCSHACVCSYACVCIGMYGYVCGHGIVT